MIAGVKWVRRSCTMPPSGSAMLVSEATSPRATWKIGLPGWAKVSSRRRSARPDVPITRTWPCVSTATITSAFEDPLQLVGQPEPDAAQRLASALILSPSA